MEDVASITNTTAALKFMMPVFVARAAGAFVELGAIVEEADPGFADPTDIFRAHWYVGAANLLRGFDGDQRARIDPGLEEIAAEGARIALMDYLSALRRRAELGAAMRRFHETYDLLLTPTLPLAAFAAGVERPDPARDEERGGRAPVLEETIVLT